MPDFRTRLVPIYAGDWMLKTLHFKPSNKIIFTCWAFRTKSDAVHFCNGLNSCQAERSFILCSRAPKPKFQAKYAVLHVLLKI